ncbi:DUF1405 domain-containing protein [Paenibacillus gansuensis]|uniref:DUF1405 domain-containing protein n=1 Tax=Paenibacillus gansuensis TaxID=306542 RepID=A0ABW5PD04_9BACL
MRLSFFWSKAFLKSRWMLWSLFITNFLGTIYGYIWYGNQLKVTAAERPDWMLIFVPDSPTASLFFTLSLMYLLWDSYSGKQRDSWVRRLVEAFAVLTSFKYGIWAVTMIFAAAAQGDTLVWQDWMLTVSHLGMAVEVLLYARFYRLGWISLAVVSIWTLLNDYMDYGQLLYPWLPDELDNQLGAVELFTVLLSIVSIVITAICIRYNQRHKQV